MYALGGWFDCGMMYEQPDNNRSEHSARIAFFMSSPPTRIVCEGIIIQDPNPTYGNVRPVRRV